MPPSISSRFGRRLSSTAGKTASSCTTAEFERLVQEHFGDRSDVEAVPMAELLKRARSKQVVILDTRPASEYVAGHITGAISVPVDDLKQRLQQLTKGKEYVAYCRGPYCVYADRAVELLRANGRRARRLLDGFPEWRAAGLPVASGVQPGVLK
jgi:rhodanese-related sulfurtransferase